MNSQAITSHKPSSAFVGASWAALLLGIAAFLVGLWNAAMQLNEKGFYFAVLVLGLYSAISLQKTVRDKLEGVAVTGIYYGISWVALIIAVLLLGAGLFNAYRKLVTRAAMATRARSARGVPAMRPVHTILSVRATRPADGVVEAVVIVQGPARTRAVALRLEGMDGRWRSPSLAVL